MAVSKTVSVTNIGTNSTDNYEIVRVTVVVSTTSSWDQTGTAYVNGSYSGGASGTLSKQTFKISKNSSITLTWDVTLPHNSDGSLSAVTFSMYHDCADKTGTTTYTYTPLTIARYFSSMTVDVYYKYETEIKYKVKFSETCSALTYSCSNGSSGNITVNGTEAEFIVTGLEQNTSYTCTVTAYRADSGLSSTVSYTTTTEKWAQILTDSYSKNVSIMDTPYVSLGNVVEYLYGVSRPKTVKLYLTDGTNKTEVATSYDTNNSDLMPSYEFTIDKEAFYDAYLEGKTTLLYSVYVTAVDSDGNTRSYTSTATTGATIINPTITSNQWTRVSATSSKINKTSLGGTFLQATLGDEKNKLIVKYRYALGSEPTGDYTTVVDGLSETTSGIVTINDNTFTVDKDIQITEATYTSICYIEVLVSDSKQSKTFIVKISKGQPVFYMTEDYVGMQKIYLNGITISVVNE